MIRQEPGNLLGEENHGEDNGDGGPEQDLSDVTALDGALPGATLLPKSHGDQRDGNHQEPRAKAQEESAGAGGSEGGGETERHTARHGGDGADDGRQRGGQPGARFHGISPSMASRTAR